ncbi:CPBP family intramembrane glutamic endopeptidase [Cyclobacterium jeungdonense]|uniref:CPBP family intramembrane metalloprotease n=1 Tax=Cyclobacterium jeungdonense TaxID=708087 RepID=A0ABT8C9U3_9BACT|nr:CPBP family intramembrane glutamic endopeptidase [Cyclobacterium jeungdonense]MDN3689554.1 CPBP family intramembrane metalloprotease [Cyclobacterium jeungdonense]
MKKKKFYLALILFVLGMLGMLSILTMDIPLPEEVLSVLGDQFTPSQIKLLILINPAIILIVAVLVGTLLYQKVNLSVPIIEKFLGIKQDSIQLREILLFGISGGILTGIVLSLLGLFRLLSPSEFELLSGQLQLTLPARVLYGGITEEIFMRFGLMTLLVWLGAKLSKGIKPQIYWMGIIISSLIFAMGHFPVVFQSVGNPSIIMITYVLLGNTIGGLVFGWLYWKKGLESAFLAHIFAHVVMVLTDQIV